MDAAKAGLGGEDVDRLGAPLLVLPAAVDQRQVRDPAGAFPVVQLAPGMRADAVPPGLQAVQDDLLAGGGRAALGSERHEREVDDAAGRRVGPGDGHHVQAVQVHVGAAGQGDRVVGDHAAFVAGAAVGADVVRREIQLLGVQLGGWVVLVLGQEKAPNLSLNLSLNLFLLPWSRGEIR